MKTKQNRSNNPSGSGKQKKKLQFEDFVRAALVSAAVICAVVLGIGGFYLVRSVYSKENHPAALSVEGGLPGSGTADALPEKPFSDTDAALAPADTGDEADGIAAMAAEAAIAAEIAAAAEAVATTAEAAAPPAETAPAADAFAAAAQSPNAVQGSTPDIPGGRKGYIALVIDDAGNNLRDLEVFLEFPGPITIAVLPGLPNSVEAARRARAAKKEVFLHQPMEPLNGQNPGPSAIFTGMSPAEVKEILIKNLNEIGPVSGFNNHEGSRATSDPAIMRPLLEVCRDGALYFLDSRTTADTVAPQIAKELNIAIAQRNIFLDNEQDRDSILAALEAGCKLAEQKGTAILIGHAWSPRLGAILKEMYPQITRRGLVFVPVGILLYRGK